MPHWYNSEISDVIHEFKSNIHHGLSSTEADQRLAKEGHNQLQTATKASAWQIPVYNTVYK
jgi:magnesium-transporting ATPase (P-type)